MCKFGTEDIKKAPRSKDLRGFENGAAERIRTFDLSLTKGVLYRLSYGSKL